MEPSEQERNWMRDHGRSPTVDEFNALKEMREPVAPATSGMPMPGCYVDSHWGQYGVARAIQVAADFGWKDTEATHLAERHLANQGLSVDEEPLSGDEFERLVEACDEAEEWLNDNATVEGYSWGWIDGDFGLYALDTEEE